MPHFRKSFFLALALAELSLGAPSAQAQDIRIGFLGGLSGPVQSLAPSVVDGAQLAMRHVNEQGGLLTGQNAVLSIADGGCNDAEKAKSAAEKLASQEVLAIVGGICSPETVAAAREVAIAGGIAMVSPASTSPAITGLEDKDLVYRTIASDAFQGQALARLIASSGISNIAVAHAENEYGRGLAGALTKAFTGSGGTVAIDLALAENKTDFSAEAVKLGEAGADIFVIIGYADGSGGAVLREAVDGGKFTKFFASDAMASDTLDAELLAKLDKRMTLTKSALSQTPGGEAFVKIAALAGVKPDGPFVGNAYDAAFLIALAIEQAGSADKAKIAAAIRDVATAPGETILPGEWEKAKQAIQDGKGVNYEGASGTVDFDAAGDVSGPFVIAEVRDGQIVETGAAD